MNALVAYLQRTQEYSTIRYIVEMTIVGYAWKLISALVFFFLVLGTTGNDISELMEEPTMGPMLVVSAVILAPLIETIVGQMIPIWFTSQVTKNMYIQALVSTVFFTLLHPVPSYGAILPIAFIFAWTYVIKKKESFGHAYGLTTLMHGLHNAIALLFIM